VSRIGPEYQKLVELRKEILEGSVEDYQEAEENFTSFANTADQSSNSLEDEIELKLETTSNLIKTFDLGDELDEAINEIELNVSRSDNVEKLIQSARECEDIRKKVREKIIESHLNETKADIFTYILYSEGKMGGKELTENLEEELGLDTKEVFEAILDLENEDLVSLQVQSV
jgi:hypothetical protein